MGKKDFAAMEAGRASGDTAARAALRSRMAHPTSLRLDEVQPNPLNPRYADDDPEVQDIAATMQRVGQLQPALAVARSQYVQAFPDETSRLGPEPWVVIVGNRRLAAARLAGRPALDVRVAAEITTPEDFEDRILIENIQRKDLPPLLEAEYLQRRLSRPGQTIRSVGESIGKSHTYVQQRLDLVRMIPEFQALFRDGVINIKTGRQLGGLPEEQQREALAAGPPYTVTGRPAGRDGNPVSNGTATPLPTRSAVDGASPVAAGNPVSKPAPTPPMPQPAPPDGNPVSNRTAMPPPPTSAVDDAAPVAAGNPVSTATTTPMPAPSAVDPGRNGSAPVQSAGTPTNAVTRADLIRLLDDTAATLDSAVEAGDQDGVIAEVRRHVEDARVVLRRAVGATATG